MESANWMLNFNLNWAAIGLIAQVLGHPHFRA